MEGLEFAVFGRYRVLRPMTGVVAGQHPASQWVSVVDSPLSAMMQWSQRFANFSRLRPKNPSMARAVARYGPVCV